MMATENGENRQLVGSSFTLAPMTDDFIDVIKSALNKTDTSNVWMETDDVTTTVRGEMIHVFDVTKAILMHAAKTGDHVAFHATYSTRCSMDSSKESEAQLGATNQISNPANQDDNEQYAAAKFSIYPFGFENYQDIINNQMETMKKYVTVSPGHYATKLEGGIIDIFTGLENVFKNTVESGAQHTVMTVSVSINSPSH